MLQGPYGFSPVLFWATFRPLTILLFILTVVSNWKFSPSRRKLLLIAFGIDTLITISTFSYFAPETEVIVSFPFDNSSIDQGLLRRSQQWASLNFIRLAGFYVAALLLLIALRNNPGKANVVGTA